MAENVRFLTEGTLTVAGPAGWELAHAVPGSDDMFNDDLSSVGCVMSGWDDYPSQPRIYLGHRDWGTVEEMVEVIVGVEQYELAAPEDGEVLWDEIQVGQIRGRRFRTDIESEYFRPMHLLGVVVTTRVESDYFIGDPLVDRHSALVTRYPIDDASAKEEIRSVWASLQATHAQ